MKSIPVSLGSDSWARGDEMAHSARAATDAHRLSGGRHISEVYNGRRDLDPMIEEAGNGRVEGIRMLEVAEMARFRDRDQFRAGNAAVHVFGGRPRRHGVLASDDDQRRDVNRGQLR